MTTREKFGTDFGGVITPHSRDALTDTSFFSDNYLQTPTTPRALEALAALAGKYGNDRYVISKCGPRMQEKTLNWMEHNGFYDITGIRPENVWFCLERPDKAPLIQQLGITAFVDDRADVLGYIDPSVTRYLYGGEPSTTTQFVAVASWEAVLRHELSE